MPKMIAKFGGMGKKARQRVKSARKRASKGSTKKTRILNQKIKKTVDYKATVPDRLKAGTYLIKVLGNIQAFPHIKKMMINDPVKGVRQKASDFFFQVATMKKTKKETIDQIVKILNEAAEKEKHDLTKLYIKSHVKIIEDFQRRHG